MPTMKSVPASAGQVELLREFSISKITCVCMNETRAKEEWCQLPSPNVRNPQKRNSKPWWLVLADVDIYFTNQWKKTQKFPGKYPSYESLPFSKGLHFGRAVGCEESETSQYWTDHLIIVDLDRWCTISIWQETHGSTKFLEMLMFPPDLLEYWRIQGVLDTRRKPGEFIVGSPSFDRNHPRAEN